MLRRPTRSKTEVVAPKKEEEEEELRQTDRQTLLAVEWMTMLLCSVW
jgi:hypothetical protein